MKKHQKVILAFDMCNTILSKSADYESINLLPKQAQMELKEPEGTEADWTDYMQSIYHRMKIEKIKLPEIKKAVEEIPLNEGFSDLFEFIRSNKNIFEGIIISGANTLYVKWIIEKNKLEDIFPYYFSNSAELDEDCLIKIKHYHYHNCKNCDKSICKRIILDDHIKNKTENYFTHKVFIGDGDNDYCPSTLLNEEDLLFAREDFYLHKMLFKENMKKNLSCKIHSWKTGRDIVKVLNKLI